MTFEGLLSHMHINYLQCCKGLSILRDQFQAGRPTERGLIDCLCLYDAMPK